MDPSHCRCNHEAVSPVPQLQPQRRLEIGIGCARRLPDYQIETEEQQEKHFAAA